MKTPIHIFTLGEKAAFYAILENFLGWATEPTYTATPAIKDELKPDPSCRLIVLLDKVRDQGGEIHIKHLFRPFVSTGDPCLDSKYIDDGEFLLLHLVSCLTDYPVFFDLDPDDIMDKADLSYLERFNRPLYQKLREHMERQAHDPLDFAPTLSFEELETLITGLRDKITETDEHIHASTKKEEMFVAGGLFQQNLKNKLLHTKLLICRKEADENGEGHLFVTPEGNFLEP